MSRGQVLLYEVRGHELFGIAMNHIHYSDTMPGSRRAKEFQRSRPRSQFGRLLILLGFTILFFTAIRKLFFVMGIPIPMRLVSQLGGISAFFSFVVGMRLYTANSTARLRTIQVVKIRLWQVLLVALFAYGIARGNSPTGAGKELIALWFFSTLWITGIDDEIWTVATKSLTVVFYVAAVLIFLTTDIVAPVTTEAGTADADYQFIGSRRTNTLAFQFRPLISSGIFLGIWGMLHRGGKGWKVLQVVAFFVAFAIQVGLFKFRSSSGMFALLILSFIILRPLFDSRRRIVLTASLAATSAVGAIAFCFTESGRQLLFRFLDPEGHPILGSRFDEIKVYFKQVGLEAFIGRGLGGYFDAREAIKKESAAQWLTLHFGILVFSLKGGVAMLCLFVSILMAAIRIRPKSWFANPCNLTAVVYFPVLIVQFMTVPFGLSPDSLLSYFPPMLVLSRFGGTDQRG